MVAAMPDGTEDFIGLVPPEFGRATLETIAIQAVMAGCLPSYMPVVCAIVRACLEPRFGLSSLQATTHPAGVCIAINGPVRHLLGFNGGAGCIGPGAHANMTVGRAVRLCMLNLGGAVPGKRDMATHGAPSKISFCFAENEEENPWGEPFHVAKGFGRTESTVTVMSGVGPHNIYDSIADSPEHILYIAAHVASSLGSNNVWDLKNSQFNIIFGPEHAATIHKAGWSKRDVCSFLYEHARLPLSVVQRGGAWGAQAWPGWLRSKTGSDTIPVLDGPDRVNIFVAGGPGKHSFWIPTKSHTSAVTVPIPEVSASQEV
jgi:hypothetical protein